MRFPKLDGRFVLAPMSGVSDIAFRALCRSHGAAMTTTEFASADGIVQGNLATHRLLEIAPEESPLAIQLFGSTIPTVQRAASMVEHKADVIDFNLGCPAWHVIGQGCGSAMLADPEKIEELVREVSGVLSKPFTVKIRTGLDDRRRNFIEVAQRCVDAGAVAVALHGRTTKQGYSGTADWSAIKELKETLDVPVIGNGDIFTPEDAVRMLDSTGCDYAMIGRGARNNPFIFHQANQLLSQGSYDAQSDAEKLSLFHEYLGLAKRFALDLPRLKTHAMSLSRGVDGAKHIRSALSTVKTLEELEKVMGVADAQ